MEKQPPENRSSANHGEGDPEAAARFNDAERAFVDSPDGRKKIRKGPEVRSDEEAELKAAEQIGREHSKGEDKNP
jgi:hypothetical protein